VEEFFFYFIDMKQKNSWHSELKRSVVTKEKDVRYLKKLSGQKKIIDWV